LGRQQRFEVREESFEGRHQLGRCFHAVALLKGRAELRYGEGLAPARPGLRKLVQVEEAGLPQEPSVLEAFSQHMRKRRRELWAK
jgi:hypothetical protein